MFQALCCEQTGVRSGWSFLHQFDEPSFWRRGHEGRLGGLPDCVLGEIDTNVAMTPRSIAAIEAGGN